MASGATITSTVRRRAGGLALAAACLGLLIVAVLLRPAGEGHGTHEQLGLPACGWVVAFDKPCPTCGMTTAYSHAVRGDLGLAFATQPMGTLLAVLTAAAFWAGIHVMATGCRLDRLVLVVLRPRMLWALAALAVAAWGYKLLTW